MAHFKIKADNDRTISFEDYGEAGGDPLIICHGGPGSRKSPVEFVTAFQNAGFRPVGIDRPGYGATSPWPGRSISGWTQDGIRVADHLKLDRFFVAGYSTGASYALAFAAAVPNRVAGVVICCGMTDQSWAHKIDEASISDEFWSAKDRNSAILTSQKLYSSNGERQRDSEANEREMLSPPDKAVVEAMQNAETDNTPYEQGMIGYVDDRLADAPSQGWRSFDVSAVQCPVIMVHGEQDWIVPVAQAHHTAELLDGSELRTFPQHGHLSVAVESIQALTDVRERANR